MIQTFSSQETILTTLKKLVIAEIRSFQTWIQANKLTINYDPQKTGYCVFKLKNRILINRNRFDTDYENE